MLGLLDDRVDLELVVVPGTADAPHAGARESLVAERHPLRDRLEHLLVEEGVPAGLVPLELAQLVGIGAERVIAPLDHGVLERDDLLLGRHLATVLEQRRMPAAAAVGDHGNERLPGHVTAEDEHVGVVVLAGVQELPPAGLGAVDVGREIEPHQA